MGIFDPKVDTEVSFQQPIMPAERQQDNALLGLAQIGMSVAGTLFDQQRQSASGGSNTKQLGMVEYQRTIGLAEAARRAGDVAKAERLENVATLNATRMGVDLGDIKASYTAITGRPDEQFNRTPEEIQMQKMMESPEYNTAFSASFALDREMTTEERQQYALSQVARQAGQAQVLQDENISWTEGKRDAFSSIIGDFSKAALGTLNQVAMEQGFVDQESIRVAEIQWAEVKSGLTRMRPEGVSDQQWSQVEAQISRVDEQLRVVKELSSAEGIEANIAATVAGAVMQNEEWTPGMKLIGLTLLKHAPTLNAIKTTRLADMATSLINFDFKTGLGGTAVDENGQEVDVGLLSPQVKDHLKEEDAQTSLERARGLATVASGVNSSKMTDPVYRDDFIKTTAIGLEAMKKIGKDNRRFISADGINGIFTGEILAGISNVASVDPTRARELYKAGYEALDQQYALSSSQLMTSLSGTVFRMQGNEVGVDRNALLSRVTPQQFSALEKAAQDFYNGNLTSMFLDMGSRISVAPGENYYDRVDEANSTRAYINNAFLGTDINTIREQIRTSKVIDSKRQQFKTGMDSLMGDTQVGGSQGEDDLGVGANRLMFLIDKHEGGGDYNTLFKHSQKEGRAFSGIQVSNMTLGELSDFSTGAYAAWSREQLGYTATPMGRYQIVGDTLRLTASEMGLPSNMKFTPAVQDAMFHHLAQKSLAGKDTPEAKRAAMRGTWDGFKNVSNSELDKAIAEFEGTSPPSYVDLQNSQTMDTTPSISTRPVLRDEDVATIAQSTAEGVSTSTGTPSTPTTPEGSQGGSQEVSEASRDEARAQTEENREKGRALNQTQINRVIDKLRELGVDPDEVVGES